MSGCRRRLRRIPSILVHYQDLDLSPNNDLIEKKQTTAMGSKMMSDDDNMTSRATKTVVDPSLLKVLASPPDKSLRSSLNDLKTEKSSPPPPQRQSSKCQTPTHHRSRSPSPNRQPNRPLSTRPTRAPSSEESRPFYAPHHSSSTTAALPLPSKETIMIQVAPGVSCPLHGGSDETWQSILDDTFVPSWCECCQMTVFCVPQVTLVLCPQCRSIFPISTDDHDNNQGHDEHDYDDRGDGIVDAGVGLGFVYEDLIRWGPEIEHERRQRRR